MKRRTVTGILVLILVCALLSEVQELSASTTILISTSNADSYVQSSTPNTNYGTAQRLRVDPRPSTIKRSLVTFNLSPIPLGQVIVQAILSLHLANPPSVSRVLEVHRVTANWTERGVTWNNQPSFQSTPTSTTNTGTTVTWLNWTVTNDVDAGYTTPSKWFGFLIKDSQEPRQVSGALLGLSSRESTTTQRPRLIVTYALQIPEIPVWTALLLGVGGVGLVWRQNSKRSNRVHHQVNTSQK